MNLWRFAAAPGSAAAQLDFEIGKFDAGQVLRRFGHVPNDV
jgi:hypothetical protein